MKIEKIIIMKISLILLYLTKICPSIKKSSKQIYARRHKCNK